jgi:hypothetical protein
MAKKTATRSGAALPRTYSEAKRRGAMPSKTTFNALTDELKAQFVTFSDSGARAGSICGHGPSDVPGMILVCFKNELGQCTWVDWPKGEPLTSHD